MAIDKKHLASIWSRLGATLIDSAILIIISGCIAYAWGRFEGSAGIIRPDYEWKSRGFLLGLLVDFLLTTILMAGPKHFGAARIKY
jgi:uncharacterized RDD family membrane protein YckC